MRTVDAKIAEFSQAGKCDRSLLIAVFALFALGLVMIASASQMVKIKKEMEGPHFHFFLKQLSFGCVGIFAMAVLMHLPYRIYRRLAVPVFAAAALLLAAVLVFGHEVRGSSRAIMILGFSFQPVEVAKLALVIFLASKISEWGVERIRQLKCGVIPLLGSAAGLACLVALQPNISNAVLIIAIAFVMLFAAGARIAHLSICAMAMLACAAPALVRISKVTSRVSEYLHGVHTGSQLDQSLIALGSGWLFGCGPGRGHQKFRFLADAHTDFIYSIVGEELGLIGTIAVLLVFVFILRRTIRAAGRAPDSFGYYLAFGSGILIFLGAAINMAMATGVIPVAGLPLPFVSYGGSSLIASLAAIGIISNVSSAGRVDPVPINVFGERRHSRIVFARRR